MRAFPRMSPVCCKPCVCPRRTYTAPSRISPASAHRLSFAAEEQAEIKQALLKLLHLIIENISKLTLADSWLDGQIGALLYAVNPPLTLRRLDDVERRIRDVMVKQEAAKGRSLQAQEEMRRMLSGVHRTPGDHE
jgi:hypothetical protein